MRSANIDLDTVLCSVNWRRPRNLKIVHVGPFLSPYCHEGYQTWIPSVFNNTILKFSQILKSTRRNSEKCSLVCKSDFYPFLRRHFIIVILSQVAVLIASSSPLRLCFGATKGLAVGAAALSYLFLCLIEKNKNINWKGHPGSWGKVTLTKKQNFSCSIIRLLLVQLELRAHQLRQQLVEPRVGIASVKKCEGKRLVWLAVEHQGTFKLKQIHESQPSSIWNMVGFKKPRPWLFVSTGKFCFVTWLSLGFLETSIWENCYM